MSRYTFHRRSLLAAAGLALPAVARAQDYPNRPLRIVVGYPPGGSNDVTARILQPHLQAAMGVPVVIENRPGANATLGTDYVARSTPDGYTVLLASSSPLVISPHTSAHVPYNTAQDFTTIATVAATPSVLAVGPATRARDLREFIAAAKAGPTTIASSGSGGLAHLAIELLRREVSQDITHVPYRGGGPAATDTMSGNVNGLIVDLAAIYGLIKDGKLRSLAVMSEQRSALLPETPTFTENGMPGIVAVNWIAVLAPARTPAPIVDRLHGALTRVATSAEVRERFASVGVEPMTQPSPGAAHAFVTGELDRWGAIARATGARAED